MASFGHAAYFGLGAYGAALLVKHLGAADGGRRSLAAPLAGGLAGALLFGWFCVRLSGVYLAMLTLAFAQIVWSVAFQWVEVTGGDNGILGVWPAPWASSPRRLLLLTLALCVGGIAACCARSSSRRSAMRLRAGARFAAARRGDRHRRRARAVARLRARRDLRGLAGGAVRLPQGQRVPRPDSRSRAPSMRW